MAIGNFIDGPDDLRLLTQAQTLIRSATDLLARDYRITEWRRPLHGPAEAFLLAWAGIAEQLAFDLGELCFAVELHQLTAEQAVEQAAARVEAAIAHLRPDARLRQRVFTLPALAPEVALAQYVVVANRLTEGLTQLLEQYRRGHT